MYYVKSITIKIDKYDKKIFVNSIPIIGEYNTENYNYYISKKIKNDLN